MKYKEWLSVWLENYVTPFAKPRTSDSYARIIDRRIAKELGEKELGELTSVELQAFVAGLMRSGNRKTLGGLAASTVNTVITVMQSSLKTAVGAGLVGVNVARGVRRPTVGYKKIDCFTPAEQKKIENAALYGGSGKMFGAVLCLYTGLRIGELLALEWSDVDLKMGLISVNKTRSAKTGAAYGEPKTPSSRRVIPVPKQIIALLRQRKITAKTEYVMEFRGKPVSVREYQRSFAAMLCMLGIEHKGFHSLRHTFATRALECGMDVKTLSEILGHKNAALTLNRYAHSLLAHKAEMMNRLGKLLPENRPDEAKKR